MAGSILKEGAGIMAGWVHIKEGTCLLDGWLYIEGR